MVADAIAANARVGAQEATTQNAEAATALQQAQAAQREAAQQAAQAARDAAQAGREAALEGARAAQQAQREAQQAMRDAQREMARAAREGQPGMQFPPFPNSGPQIPEGVVVISIAFFVMCAVIAIGLPIARAIARRSDRRGTAPATDADTRARLERIEQAVDAIAVEVERISEGQRFTTKIMSEFRALPQPDAAAGLAERASDRAAVPIARARDAR
jgi:multidrug efflux pump subunit AcrA (membrane-fusion protein)